MSLPVPIDARSPGGPAAPGRGRRAAPAFGFSLIEMMVAVTIGLFIALGLSSVFVNTKVAFNSQNSLAQLQDSERMTMTVLTAAVQQAGYYPDPTVGTPAAELFADTTAQVYGQFAAGQGVVGASAALNGSDVLAARFVSAPGDGLTTCQDQTNPSAAANGVMLSVFSISANNELQCQTAIATAGAQVALGAAVPLVSNISQMSVLYGTATGGNGTVDQYLTATEVTTRGLWGSVMSAQITLTFINPFAASQGASAPPVTWVQTVGVMNTI